MQVYQHRTPLDISRFQGESSRDNVDLRAQPHAANSPTCRLADDTLIKLLSSEAACIRLRLPASTTTPVSPDKLQYSLRSFEHSFM